MTVTVDHLGKIIHHCGAIEFVLNNQIMQLSNDDILVEEIVKTRLHKRADILKKLLERERKDLESDYIKSLIADIKKLGDERNIIAHNPLISKDESLTDMKIMFYKKGEHCEYSVEDINRILKLSLGVLNRIAALQNDNS